MTIPVAKAGEQSLLMKIGYPAVVSMLEQKLSRVTRLIPKTFTTAVVVIIPFDSRPSVSPDDGLVLIEPFPERSNLSKVSRDKAINDTRALGMTELDGRGGITAVVFRSRILNDGPVAVEQLTNAVIHELAHAKSGLTEPMHDANPRGILAKDGATPGRNFIDSDAQWLSKYLGKQIVFEMKYFSGAK
jgi:hypothetical protein